MTSQHGKDKPREKLKVYFVPEARIVFGRFGWTNFSIPYDLSQLFQSCVMGDNTRGRFHSSAGLLTFMEAVKFSPGPEFLMTRKYFAC